MKNTHTQSQTKCIYGLDPVHGSPVCNLCVGPYYSLYTPLCKTLLHPLLGQSTEWEERHIGPLMDREKWGEGREDSSDTFIILSGLGLGPERPVAGRLPFQQ